MPKHRTLKPFAIMHAEPLCGAGNDDCGIRLARDAKGFRVQAEANWRMPLPIAANAMIKNSKTPIAWVADDRLNAGAIGRRVTW